MDFTKMQAAGNDFILVETGDTDIDWTTASKAMCDRHYGIGADGLLLLLPSDIAEFKMRTFNADGSESETCGNGLRCMVRYYLDKGNNDGKTGKIRVETATGIREAEYSATSEIKAGMGKPVFDGYNIPVQPEQCRVDIKQLLVCNIAAAGNDFKLNLVSMGNPHSVYFTDNQIVGFPLSDIGPEIATNEIFLQGVNFTVARILDRENIEARVWERGVGETLACGSGSCAVAVSAILHDYVDNKVNVHLPGGILIVDWDGSGEVYLSGPADAVFSGKWEI
ncbi:MAG: diaminopimelate epimerase [Dehalococcoidales bacterium]|nr:MAG: diaminopimelate epimerase [Dehalococcoidales bacterium]